MELAPAGVPLTFEVTFDANNLHVAMSVYDTTNPSSPTRVQAPTAMTLLTGNTYFGNFEATAGHAYVIYKAVYTDGTFATLSPDYAQGTESIYAENISSGSAQSICPVVGFVDESQSVIGLVNC